MHKVPDRKEAVMSMNVNIVEEVPSTVQTLDLNTALTSILTEFSRGVVGGALTDPATGQKVGTWVADGPAFPAMDPTAAATPVAAVPGAAVPGAAAPAAPVAQPGYPAAVPAAVAAPASVTVTCEVRVFAQNPQAPSENHLVTHTSVPVQVANGVPTVAAAPVAPAQPVATPAAPVTPVVSGQPVVPGRPVV